MRNKTIKLLYALKMVKPEMFTNIGCGNTSQKDIMSMGWSDYEYDITELSQAQRDEIKVNLLAEIFHRINIITNIVITSFVLGIVGFIIGIIISLIR